MVNPDNPSFRTPEAERREESLREQLARAEKAEIRYSLRAAEFSAQLAIAQFDLHKAIS